MAEPAKAARTTNDPLPPPYAGLYESGFMKAILLIGHGALNKASGASMIRHAALLKKGGVAEFATAGFLNFSRPTFAEAAQRCADKGATHIVVQPYFLINGYYVDSVLTRLVEEARAAHPTIRFTQMQPFGDHPALATLVIKRLHEAEAELTPRENSALLLMAHGTPRPHANEPIYAIAEQVEAATSRPTRVAFMECNTPSIPGALAEQVAGGAERITALPYFLQSGGHVREDLPQAVGAAQRAHPHTEIVLAGHLDYDELLVDVIRARALVEA